MRRRMLNNFVLRILHAILLHYVSSHTTKNDLFLHISIHNNEKSLDAGCCNMGSLAT